MNRKCITPPSTWPVSLTEIKDHLSIEGDEFDDLLQAYIQTATALVEKETGRAIMPQTWEIYSPCWRNRIPLPLPPTQAVTFVKYYDENNTLQTLNSSLYRFNQTNLVSFIEFDHNASLPTVYERADAIVVRFTNGSSTVLDLVKHAVKLTVAGWFNWREGEIDRSTNELALGVSRLLSTIRVGDYV